MSSAKTLFSRKSPFKTLIIVVKRIQLKVKNKTYFTLEDAGYMSGLPEGTFFGIAAQFVLISISLCYIEVHSAPHAYSFCKNMQIKKNNGNNIKVIILNS